MSAVGTSDPTLFSKRLTCTYINPLKLSNYPGTSKHLEIYDKSGLISDGHLSVTLLRQL